MNTTSGWDPWSASDVAVAEVSVRCGGTAGISTSPLAGGLIDCSTLVLSIATFEGAWKWLLMTLPTGAARPPTYCCEEEELDLAGGARLPERQTALGPRCHLGSRPAVPPAAARELANTHRTFRRPCRVGCRGRHGTSSGHRCLCWTLSRVPRRAAWPTAGRVPFPRPQTGRVQALRAPGRRSQPQVALDRPFDTRLLRDVRQQPPLE
jgi:hypothetical protein